MWTRPPLSTYARTDHERGAKSNGKKARVVFSCKDKDNVISNFTLYKDTIQRRSGSIPTGDA